MIEAFSRTTDDILSLGEFKALLATGRKLRIKFGADVTAPFLHLGHGVNLWMMRELQERGHLVQFLIGDFTTRIGDPTGRSSARVPPSPEAMERDAQAFLRQVGRVLITDDPEVFEVRRNSEWWTTMAVPDFLGLAGSLTARRLLSRDMFRAREAAGGEVRLDEMVYPVLQGWDSVMLRSDLTIVGSDQLFNEALGRHFQEAQGQRPQVVITTKITPGLDGVRKQSKSLDNFVALEDGPRTMFGKVMSLPDGLIRDWFLVYTTVPEDDVDAALDQGPRRAKAALAGAVVERWHGPEAARAEAEWFEATFARGAFPADAPLRRLSPGPLGALALAELLSPGTSRSELRRMVAQGGLKVDGSTLSPESTVLLEVGRRREVRLGKRRFLLLEAESRS